ncbi:transporter substrate-binding domain-containing protein [Roseibium denhamense]|nr:ABC transporter substrate-binding protein [Roseibium denhamense]MTI07384.1 transporter substrate-binding domain-containing protein [Roseibium denhamense]
MVIMITVAAPAGAAMANPPTGIKLVTQNFAPLQFEQDGESAGYVTDTLLEVIKRVNETYPLEIESYDFLPWKRAMLIAESEPNVLFFSLSRTPAREERFHWLGEVSPYGQNFYQLKGRPKIEAESVADLLKQDVRIGIQDGGSHISYLRKLDPSVDEKLVLITDFRQGIDMLFLERIDLLPLTRFLAKGAVCGQGHNGDDIEPVVYIDALASPLWAVFSKGTDDALVDAFKTELAALAEEGFTDRRFRYHVEAWQQNACAEPGLLVKSAER